jgi:PAS domain S-box-containing protein
MPDTTPPEELSHVLEPGVRDMLAALAIPAYAIDADGVLVWSNHATTELVGERVGSSYLDLVPPRHHETLRSRFIGKLNGAAPTTEKVEILDRRGRRVEVLVRSVLVRHDDAGRTILGIALPLGRDRAPEKAASAKKLTPRQDEVLRLLAEGLDTDSIASRMGVALETARNHIRAVLRRLDAHTRLEAVLAGSRLGLLDLDP